MFKTKFILERQNYLYMRINSHRHGKTHADRHFASVGWDNVTMEIIDHAINSDELTIKESELIQKALREHKYKVLNKYCLNIDGFHFPPTEFRQLFTKYNE